MYEICSQHDYSILQLGKRLPGSSYIVLEFGDKVLKFGKKCRILNVPSLILQPEEVLPFDNNYQRMYIYERVPYIFPRDDFATAQEMYNRARDKGVLWFDAIGNNVGKTTNLIDENDDGLRIIDPQYMEYTYEVLDRINPEKNPQYSMYGIGGYDIALRDYICQNGNKYMEECYQKMVDERSKASKADVEKTAETTSVKGLGWIKKVLEFLYGKDFFDDGIGK